MKTIGLTRPVKASRIFVCILALVSLFVSTLGFVSLRGPVAAADLRTNMSSAIRPASVGTGIPGDNSSVVNHAVPWRNQTNVAVSGGAYLYSYPMAAVGAGT